MVNNTDFQKALGFVLVAEGGYSNDPADPGGATNLGIIQTEYDLWRREIGASTQSVRHITREEAASIYYNKYWLAAHCNGLPARLATVVFDTAVNMGVGTAIEMLCKVLRVPVAVQFTAALSKAVHAYDGASRETLTEVVTAYIARRRRRYYAIVARRPRSLRFLGGWLHRLTTLYQFVR